MKRGISVRNGNQKNPSIKYITYTENSMDSEGCILKKKKMRLFGGKPRGHIAHQKMILLANHPHAYIDTLQPK